MSKSITQDMQYRQSLMKYAEKYGVSQASRKYNKSRSYIYLLVGRAGTGHQSHWLAGPVGPTAIPISTQRRR